MRDLFRYVTFLLTCLTICIASPLAYGGGDAECALAPGELRGNYNENNGDELHVSDYISNNETKAYPISPNWGWNACYAKARTQAITLDFPKFVYWKFIDSDDSDPISGLVDAESPTLADDGDERYYKPGKNCFSCYAVLYVEDDNDKTEKKHSSFVIRSDDKKEGCDEKAKAYLADFYLDEATRASRKAKEGEDDDLNVREVKAVFTQGPDVWVEWEADDQMWPVANSTGEFHMSRFDIVDEIFAEALLKVENEEN